MSIKHTIMTKISVKDTTQSSIHNNTSEISTPFRLSEARTVNVIAGGKKENDIQLLDDLLEVLSERGFHVRIMCDYPPCREIKSHDAMSIAFFSRRDFSIFGSPKSPLLKEFIDTASDIFIDITSSNSKMVRKICLRMKYRLSIGVNPASDVKYDFVYTIPYESDTRLSFEKMIDYLSLINS